jgi:biopolymer transport protein TolR
MSDINMTPLIDVMLVLLVIFIITAPLMASSLKLDLPRAEGAPAATHRPSWPWPSTPRAASVPGRTAGGRSRRARTGHDPRARGRTPRPRTEVQLRADSRVPYGRVAELIGWVQQAGLTRIGFVTEAPAPR